jgi:hypothetical protein
MNIYTPQFLYNTAVEFHSISVSRCRTIFNKKYFNQQGIIHLQIIVPATNLSFALELIIKAILISKTGRFPKKHNLLHLYIALPDSARTDIEKIYKTLKVSKTAFPSFRFVVTGSPPDTRAQYDSISDEIIGQLKIHDDSFVKWRYVFSFTEEYESVEFDFAFIIKLFRACAQYHLSVLRTEQSSTSD